MRLVKIVMLTMMLCLLNLSTATEAVWHGCIPEQDYMILEFTTKDPDIKEIILVPTDIAKRQIEINGEYFNKKKSFEINTTQVLKVILKKIKLNCENKIELNLESPENGEILTMFKDTELYNERIGLHGIITTVYENDEDKKNNNLVWISKKTVRINVVAIEGKEDDRIDDYWHARASNPDQLIKDLAII